MGSDAVDGAFAVEPAKPTLDAFFTKRDEVVSALRGLDVYKRQMERRSRERFARLFSLLPTE